MENIDWLDNLHQAQWDIGGVANRLDVKADALYEIGLHDLPRFLAFQAATLREIQLAIARGTSGAVLEFYDISNEGHANMMRAIMLLIEGI